MLTSHLLRFIVNLIRSPSFSTGAMAFAVTTGVFSKRELEAHFTGLDAERCVVFDGLEDTQAVLEACGLK